MKLENARYMDEWIRVPLCGTGDKLYHYTTAEGARGIVQDKKFMATKSDFLNDKLEFQYALEVMEKLVQTYLVNETFAERFFTLVKEEIRRLGIISIEDGEDGPSDRMSFYVVAFSKLQNNALLWAEFTEFHGYCLEFSYEKLVEGFEERAFLHGTVIYDEKEQKRVWLGAYAGYYMIPVSCKSAASILERLRTALNMAKNVRKTEYVFFDEELMQGIRMGKMIEATLPEAIHKQEFQVYYQPKIMLKDYRLVGAEALCRWFKDGKVVAPGEFVPILEQSNLICLLDFYMLEHVCQDIRRWLDEGKKVVTVSVNLSRAHMGDMDLLDHILGIIEKYQIPHKYIEIELTETGTDVDFNHLKTLVSGLREQGIATSVDDFGTGYSSINLIRELPWSVIKIDKSFLPGKYEQDEHKRMMIKHLIAMAQDMDRECIVEGVETVEQIKLLKESNCYLAQGYYFDKPLPVHEFEKKLMEI